MAQSDDYIDDEMMGLSGFILRLNLDLAYTAEKSATLAAFSSHLGTSTSTENTETDFSSETSFESTIISAIIENSIRELEASVDMYRKELIHVRETAPESEPLNRHLTVLQWRLRDCDTFLKLSRDRVSELKMTTSEKGDDDSREAEWGRVLEAENASEVLKGISKELLLQMEGCEGDSEKVGFLERRLKVSEATAEAMKLSAEAGQNKERMLCSAIWDMENLIGDLKEGVSISEKKAETATEQCRSLAETNTNLTREVLLLRGRVERLQKKLGVAMDENVMWGKEVNKRTNAVMELVARIGAERGRVHTELVRLTTARNDLSA